MHRLKSFLRWYLEIALMLCLGKVSAYMGAKILKLPRRTKILDLQGLSHFSTALSL